ncbi:uncharacterized protein KGF55_004009 [Candida pseudojiufengensis]|uniref:uncharacterized protein n=1 Tax=Candida pseudojiufengensis TaxID=497109 RepID=UPI002224CE11|nr:uncharacterized protein KGF55_004009 [Candida pseudojiufengensis]KAI5961386.1 hypothetical protein KGF55_004009 [Candida pseudojiufengensis]
MFKTSSYSSYLIPTWFKKPQTKQTTSIDPSTIPKSFNISNDDNKLINILMKEHHQNIEDKEGGEGEQEEEFIDIQTKQLSYAEVALLGQNKKQQTTNSIGGNYKFKSKPSKGKILNNQYNVLTRTKDGDKDLEHLEDSTNFEPFKNDDEYLRSLNYKNKQYKSIKDKKLKSKNYKQKLSK